eukprot:Unigene9344_Nuclearia_a/m.28519 Unigene9344_Nuclearia_a/g.28519  ORF Unigene9344_Nuclearia_a/g.28519 Unigene9344_Nuclearia_a/m.28519 type:complete len:125 (+) Unigene9344_Nuclearia_a:42-416(+)
MSEQLVSLSPAASTAGASTTKAAAGARGVPLSDTPLQPEAAKAAATPDKADAAASPTRAAAAAKQRTDMAELLHDLDPLAADAGAGGSRAGDAVAVAVAQDRADGANQTMPKPSSSDDLKDLQL